MPDGTIARRWHKTATKKIWWGFLTPGFLESTPVRERPDGEVEALRREIVKLQSTVDLLLKKGRKKTSFSGHELKNLGIFDLNFMPKN